MAVPAASKRGANSDEPSDELLLLSSVVFTVHAEVESAQSDTSVNATSDFIAQQYLRLFRSTSASRGGYSRGMATKKKSAKKSAVKKKVPAKPASKKASPAVSKLENYVKKLSGREAVVALEVLELVMDAVGAK